MSAGATMLLLAKTVLPPDHARFAVMILLVAAMMVVWRNPRQVAALALTAALVGTLLSGAISARESVRSFFGVHKIGVTPDGRFRLLSHGTTVHGAMRLKNEDGTPAA